MKKRLLSLILALCIIISFSPSTLAANLPEVDVRTEAYPGAAPGGARREAEGRRRGAADDLCLERRYRGGRRRDRRNADHAGPCNRIGKRREKTGRNRGLRTGISRYLD